MSRDDSEERDELIAQTVKLKAEQERLKGLIEQYRDSDPEIIEKEKAEIEVRFINLLKWGL
jgi:hypothetical protein